MNKDKETVIYCPDGTMLSEAGADYSWLDGDADPIPRIVMLTAGSTDIQEDPVLSEKGAYEESKEVGV